MTNKDFFVQALVDEMPRFERVLAALPEDKLSYKNPDDPKAKTALGLTTAMVMETNSFVTFLSTGSVEMSSLHAGAPENLSGLQELMAKAMAATKQQVEGMSDEEWDSKAAMTMSGKEVWTTTRGGMAWALLFDLIHHRGQLSTYIRPMGGLVPSIYGPSADSGE